MRSKNNKPLNVALFGMDGRSLKTMTLYLQGPCKGKAVVVNELDAEADIIDADCINAKEILEDRRLKSPNRPIILLSLEELKIEGTLYVKKPVETNELLEAVAKVAAILRGEKIKKEKPVVKVTVESTSNVDKDKSETVAEKKQAGNKHIDREEIKKVSKHRTAKDLTESGFSAYIGHIEGIDFNDKEQVLKASYHPKSFFLGYVQSACRVAKAKARILILNSSWKPLVIFPQSNEVWLDVDDKQLRAFAGLVIKENAQQSMSLTPIEHSNIQFNQKMESFYDMESFIWKLAIWTSKGRYPDSIDIHRPVYLKRWPNFTRLIITPHALRITALLIKEPRTLVNISESLKIKPQYVFIFISAAHALGLVGQAKREADQVVAPAKIEPSKSKSLLGRILSRLRGKEIKK